MLDIAPFVATHYADPARLPTLTALAYDLVAPAERERLIHADEHSIVHLTLPTFGAHDAARRLARWRGDGTLDVDSGPALYLYDIVGPTLVEPGAATAHASTRGWIGAVALDEQAVVPHERTVPEVVADRLELRAVTHADLEPVVLAHDGAPGAADELAHRIVARDVPVVDLVDDTGVRHRLWRVADPVELAIVTADLGHRRAVIADGHHRWASCLAHRGLQPGRGPWDRCLALVVPVGVHGPDVLAIHRVVPGLDLDRAVTTGFRCTPIEAPVDPGKLLAAATEPLVLLTDGERWRRLTDPDRDALLAGPPQWRDLDVALVDVVLVGAAWGAADTVLLRHSVEEAIATARAAGGVAVLLRPTPAATVLDLAARGVLMPRKSTLFVPKPRTGLVLRCFADQVAVSPHG